eukprot:gnl/MRDRNA2_/MRDRNA2_128968_c0_seq1.p1 gnl/MRDRNA2_/MRDRNA2_128968_c0~~gnl/MRDRNA2_/MRDRNA2_128968_c0_seq1.p1  ORF type:complete len:669 (+),score=132.87 gnl/MRDRNA2_/MRDRNA2_128968_c0_seq1:108-2009(+)
MTAVATYFEEVVEGALEHPNEDVRLAAALSLRAFPKGESLAEKSLQVAAEVQVLKITNQLWAKEAPTPQVLVFASIRIQFTKRVEQTLREHVSLDEQITKHLTDYQNELQAVAKQLARFLKKVTEPQHQQLLALISLFRELRDTLLKLLTAGDRDAFWKGELRFYESDGRIKCMCADAQTMLRQECASFASYVVADAHKELRRAYFQAMNENKVLVIDHLCNDGTTRNQSGVLIESFLDIARTIGREPIMFNASSAPANEVGRQATDVFKKAKKSGNKIPVIIEHADLMKLPLIDSITTQATGAGALLCLTIDQKWEGRTNLDGTQLMSQNIVTRMDPSLWIVYAHMFCLQGFESSDNLGPRMEQFVDVAKKKLQQPFYDWGWRFAKSVVNKAGQLLAAQESIVCPDEEEETALFAQAFRNVLWCRSRKEDKQQVESIVNELFGRLNFGALPPLPKKLQVPDHWSRTAAMVSYVQERHGKLCYMVLPVAPQNERACITAMEREATDADVEVKVLEGMMAEMNAQKFFGERDSDGCWVDGYLTKAIRSMQDVSKAIWCIVICGDIKKTDPSINEIFKTLKSLLDGNRMLCLASGETLTLKEEHRIIFLAQEGIVSVMNHAWLNRLAFIYSDSEE